MELKAYLEQERVFDSTVECWEETVKIPTYEIGEQEKNPIFLEKRVYQGSSGSVYPYAVVESVSDEKHDKEWRAVFLENRYLKVMILPELGGRIHKAYDKIKKRDFIYYNQVIKPALVGLTGPWISGGIEFNWPQHHRPSTFLPIESTTSRNEDGSCTVWVNELERMFGSKAMVGFTLHPDRAYIEIKANLYNGTTLPQTFLWWANPAVKVNDDYQSVFPPDVNAVFDHGKRDVSTFPIATGTYYKVDYSTGVDISRYKNIPVPTSYMAVNSEYDFVGGYENDTQGGVLHVASHHISPGKKQWTWGYGDFGRAWDRNLTDEDGPYIELMTGVYTDNQPDFSWLQPYEEKQFTQYFMPYADLGVVSNATKEALLKVEEREGELIVRVYVTAPYGGATLRVCCGDEEVCCCENDFLPEETFVTKIDVLQKKSAADFCVSLASAEGRVLVEYAPPKKSDKEIPSPATAAKEPHEIESNEQLFLTGQHLEQYRHATYLPEDYYGEALRRDPKDSRCNNAMGVLLMRKGCFAEAETHLRAATQTLTERNPNPYDGEPLYNLGQLLRYEGRNKEAYDVFYKSCWNAAMQDAGYLSVARIDASEGRLVLALENVERSLIRNSRNYKSRLLKSALLRLLGETERAKAWNAETLLIDRFNVGTKYENYLLSGDEAILEEICSQLKNTPLSYLEYAMDYLWAGLYDQAEGVLRLIVKTSTYPMFHYAMGYVAACRGDRQTATEWYAKAETMPTDYCFPNTLTEVLILESAIAMLPQAVRASYYLGNFMYAKRVYDRAVVLWERAADLDNGFATVFRNLALAYYNKMNRKEEALKAMERAFDLDKTDARVFMELDQLYKKLNRTPLERLERMNAFFSLVERRDDLYIEYIALLNFTGAYQKALEATASRQFHPWEGGEGKITSQFLICRIELAKKAIREGAYECALEWLNSTRVYPHNLGEGKLPNAAENEVDYYCGVASEALGRNDEAKRYFMAALKGESRPQAAWFYNDASPDRIYYQGLALEKLGRKEEAFARFDALKTYGEQHRFDEVKIDYFAVSLPDFLIWEEDLQVRNAISCNYLKGLGCLGLGETACAKACFDELLALNASHPCSILVKNLKLK